MSGAFSQTIEQGNKKSEVEQFADMAWIKGGKFLRGSSFKENQAALKVCRKYDRSCQLWWFSDEFPRKLITLKSYWIDIYETTNAQYLKFVKATGHRPALDDTCTTDSCREGNLWKGESFSSLIRNQPVTQVNWYDAVAYCEWKGKRLPTEAEWEKAACWNDEKQEKTTFPWGNSSPTEENCNLLESYHWGCTEIGTYPKGKSPSGCQQMIGDVWEWTSSEFVGYPGFKSGFDEYNDKWFTNQKVLRGGSFGTPNMSIRGSYRNFFRLDERWLFSGFRCVEKI